ncbi:MAG: hypothetical protein V2I48_09470 [Xanthomonadales bacterium]|nr:hypothetical protein [Xanthomonadales bacterium]
MAKNVSGPFIELHDFFTKMVYDFAMIGRPHGICLLLAGMGLCAVFSAGNAFPISEGRPAICGAQLSARDVLVLDVQHLSSQPELAQQYVLDQAGEYRLAKPIIQELILKSRPGKDPDAAMHRLRRLGVERGCDLVVVLKTGPYLGRQRGRNVRMKDQGYVMVSIGQRTVDGH